MSPKQAQALLDKLGYVPGRDSTGLDARDPKFREHRGEIKAACLALKRAAQGAAADKAAAAKGA